MTTSTDCVFAHWAGEILGLGKLQSLRSLCSLAANPAPFRGSVARLAGSSNGIVPLGHIQAAVLVVEQVNRVFDQARPEFLAA